MLTRRLSADDSTANGAAAGRAGVLGGATAVVAAALVPSCVAHSWQNLAVGGFTKPQLGQPADSGEAHSMQNFAPTTFSVEQFGQITL